MSESATNLSWGEFRLPSRGVLYEDQIPDGMVSVRKPTVREEELLNTTGARFLQRIGKYIDACCRTPNKFPKNSLLVTDRMAILLAIRSRVFGSRYTFDYQCPHCKGMNKETIDIAEDLDEVTPDAIARRLLTREDESIDDFEVEEPFTLTLPACGDDIAMRYMRGTDEELIFKHAKRTSMRSADSNDQSVAYRIATLIVKLKDRDDLPMIQREDYVNQLTSDDSLYLQRELDIREPGIDMRVWPTCSRGQCGATVEMVMPFTAEFFRPS
jgi:hypothetical protein